MGDVEGKLDPLVNVEPYELHSVLIRLAKNYPCLAALDLPTIVCTSELFVIFADDEWSLQWVGRSFVPTVKIDRVVRQSLGGVLIEYFNLCRRHEVPGFVGGGRLNPVDEVLYCELFAQAHICGIRCYQAG